MVKEEVFILSTLKIMTFYKLDKEFPQTIRELEERRKSQTPTKEG